MNEGLSHKETPDDEKMLSAEPRDNVQIPSQQLLDREDRPSEQYEGFERIRPQYEVPFRWFYLFQET